MKKLKKIPKFKSEDAEREFWSTHDSTEYVDWSKAKRLVLPNLKLSEELLELKISRAASKKLRSLAEEHRISENALAQKYILEGLKRDGKRAGV
jgi:hypothetical protein